MSLYRQLGPLAGRISSSPLKQRAARTLILALLCFHAAPVVTADQPPKSVPEPRISRKAADSCSKKVEALEREGARTDRRRRRTTRFSEDEMNSYLALELKAKFHPSLRSLVVSFREDSLSGSAEIDFDNLSMSSTKTLTKMIARLFSGVHKLEVRGKLVAEGGKGNFQLDEARFDGSLLPNFLVSEVITAVGRKQKPPFDPLQPSPLPYAIQKVDVRAGQIIVYQ